MNKSLRNSLRLAITSCRKLLEDDYSRKLEGKYGIHANGTVESLEKLPLLDARGQAQRLAIEASLSHEQISGVTL
ncbi:hypothetical protein H8D57_04080, partial [bacterium]|nr:hypothetical protein [bacterium]